MLLPFDLAVTTPSPVIHTDAGVLSGTADDKGIRFLGIPFAAPPVGPLRWAPPAPVQPWTGVRDAKVLSSKPPQLRDWGGIPQLDEDCLYLNIYAPAGGAVDKPVLVWFHGGAFVAGAAQDVDGSALAQSADVIVVTVGYRLGIFGFLSLPELDREQGGPSGNYGIRDQQVALRWVQANIRAFGGDPAKVTIIGESAGGMSVWVHLVSKYSRGLFAQAVSMSGPGNIKIPSRDEEQRSGLSSFLAADLGCADADDVLACLRQRSVADILAVGVKHMVGAPSTPVIDGDLISDNILELVETGKAVPAPMMSGWVSNEGSFFTHARAMRGMPYAPDDLEKYFKNWPAVAVSAHYPKSPDVAPETIYAAIITDNFASNTLRMNKAASKYQSVFTYEFDDPHAQGTVFDIVGSCHTHDIPYFFGSNYPNELKPQMPDLAAGQQALSGRMMAALRQFAWTGKPGPDDVWTTDGVARLTPEGDRRQAVEDVRARYHADLWDAANKNMVIF